MPKIYKYEKVQTKYTTYLMNEPDYELSELKERITELCTVDGKTYVSVPDTIILPEQPPQLTVKEITLTEELREKIKNVSCHVWLINERAKTIKGYNKEKALEKLGLN